ncbi:DUF3592 domain-containing protein [Hypnocyclicus thermotrophus]|uniref:DUF3592 domain-containing protein n=1 Tax=Hypnocyclicus thermotrophus TaxID=1627895 RepID=UPI003FA3D453
MVSFKIEKDNLVKRYELPNYNLKIEYNYSVNEKKYNGDNIYFGYKPSKFSFVLEKKRGQYDVGNIVIVFYDPLNPEISVIEPGIHFQTLEYPLIGILLMLMFIYNLLKLLKKG